MSPSFIARLYLLSGVVALTLSAAPAADKVPTATGLGTVGRLGWSTTRPPTVAVSDRGTVYVLWARPGQRKAPPPEGLPRIPDALSFGPAAHPERGTAPAVSVRRKGKWSRPGLLVDGLKDCVPVFAWCQGERLHLLLAGPKEEECNHLLCDPAAGKWTKVAKLPLVPSQYDPIRQVGKAVHLACEEGGYVHYLRFDGTSWSKPLRIEASANRTSGVTRARLAVGRDGAAHVAWWAATTAKGTHGYAAIRGGKVRAGPLRFGKGPLDGEEFDLGIDPEGRLLLAYKADLPKGHRDVRKLHVRRLGDKGWTDAETIGGEWEELYGHVRVVWTTRRAMLTWLAREETGVGGGTLSHSVRRVSVTDGKGWSRPRPLARAEGGLPRFGGIPAGPIALGLCVDKHGDVHAAWGSPEAFHCVVARLGGVGRGGPK